MWNKFIWEEEKAREDGLQSVQLEHRLGRDLDGFFLGWIDLSGVTYKIDVDAYWTSSGLNSPAGYNAIGVYSRKLFSYPMIGVVTMLPTLAANLRAYIGFEPGREARLPAITFHMRDANAGLYCLYEGGVTGILVTSQMPVDYETVVHHYMVKVNRCNGELYIDRVLRAVMLFGLPVAIPTWDDTVPYSLGSMHIPIVGDMPSFLEISKGTDDITLPLDITGQCLVITNGDPMAPRQYPMYTENTATQWKALATGGVVLTSHPVPGYTS